jgi:DNA-binding CsgD family transcriptional regulator
VLGTYRVASAMTPDDRLLELIGDTAGLLELAEFRVEVLAALRRAVPADWASLNDIGAGAQRAVVITDPVAPADLVDAFVRYAHQDPIVARYGQTGDARPIRFSDIVSTDELHALELYTEVYRPMGVEYQIAFTLPSVPGRVVGIALSRGDRDFSDDERDLLDRSRSFLIQAYRNAMRYTQALAGARPVGVAELIALGLTARQAEVLRLVATGLSERDIAGRLGISHRTVQKHLERAYRELGVSSRSEAAELAWG